MNYSITRDNGGVIAWTDEQVAYIIKKYTEENVSLKQLGKEFGCAPGSIKNLLHNKKIKTHGAKHGYPRNEHYFTIIDTPEKAYWLGFLYADGCVHNNRNEVSVSSIDKEHLEKFKKAIGAVNHKITVFQSKQFPDAKPTCIFSIRDKQIHDDLIKWGCAPNKSLALTKIPNIPRDYVSHFLRGYFDGDGSLHYLKGTNNYRISIAGTPEFLDDVQKELGTNLSYNHSSQIYQLQIAGRKQVTRILQYFYKDSNENIRLNRKYSIYLKELDWAHRH